VEARAARRDSDVASIISSPKKSPAPSFEGFCDESVSYRSAAPDSMRQKNSVGSPARVMTAPGSKRRVPASAASAGSRGVGPAGYCSLRHGVPFTSRDEGLADIARYVIGCHLPKEKRA